jgi:predicted LPLAT superfamily acyltransferase
MKPEGWAGVAEAGSAWGLTLLYRIYRLVGRGPFRLLLGPVLLYFFLFRAEQRRASKEYLERILGRKPGIFSSLRHFYSFAEAIIDKLIAFNGGFTLGDVVSQGREAVEAYLSKGKGVFLVSAHMGNLEVCRALSHEQSDLRLQVLVHTRHAENFNRLIHRLNPGAQVNLHQVSELGVGQAAWLSDRISCGESLVIAADRNAVRGGRTVKAPFLGALADFPQGPWILAALMGAPVFLIFCIKEQGVYHIYYEPFAEQVALPRSGREAAVAELAARYAARLEHYCRKDPYQWFNFFSYWQKHD